MTTPEPGELALVFVRERNGDADGVVTSSPVCNPLIVPTMLAGHGDAIGALVAALAMPLPPVTALAAHFAVPGTASLYYAAPAEGIPIASTAFRAKIRAQQLFQRHSLSSTGQLVGCLQFSISEELARFDVLDRADGQVFDVHPVQQILTVSASTAIVTGLVVLKTSASVGPAACLAVAMVFLFHNRAP
jgi:hypothetical protein